MTEDAGERRRRYHSLARMHAYVFWNCAVMVAVALAFLLPPCSPPERRIGGQANEATSQLSPTNSELEDELHTINHGRKVSIRQDEIDRGCWNSIEARLISRRTTKPCAPERLVLHTCRGYSAVLVVCTSTVKPPQRANLRPRATTAAIVRPI